MRGFLRCSVRFKAGAGAACGSGPAAVHMADLFPRLTLEPDEGVVGEPVLVDHPELVLAVRVPAGRDVRTLEAQHAALPAGGGRGSGVASGVPVEGGVLVVDRVQAEDPAPLEGGALEVYLVALPSRVFLVSQLRVTVVGSSRVRSVYAQV